MNLPPRMDGSEHSTGVSLPVHLDLGKDERPKVMRVEPTHYLPKPAYARFPRMEQPFPVMGKRSVESLDGVTPVFSPALTPPSEEYGNPALKLAAPFSLFPKTEGAVLGVTEYEVQSAGARRLEKMETVVKRLHKRLQFPLPPPLDKMDVQSLTRETIPLGSVQLTVAMAKVMWETIEQHEAAKNARLEREGKTVDAFYRAILRSAELQELREDLEAATEFYCRRSHIPEGYIPCEKPFVIPGSPEIESDPGYISEGELSEKPSETETSIASQPSMPPPLIPSREDELQEQLEESQQAVEQLKTEVEQLYNHLEEERSHAEGNEQAIQLLSQELEAKTQLLNEREAELETLKGQWEQLTANNHQLTNENASLLEQQQRQQTLIEQLQQTETDIRTALAETLAAKAKLEETIEILEREFASQKDLFLQKSSELDQEQQRSRQAEVEAADRLQEVHDLLEESASSNAELKSQLEQLTLAESHLKGQLAEAEQQLEQAKSKSEAELSAAAEAFEIKHKKTKDELWEAGQALETLKKERDQAVEDVMNDLFQIHAELETKNEQISSLAEAAEASKALEASLNTQLEELNRTLQSVEKDKASLESKIEELELSVAEKEQQLNLLHLEAENTSKLTQDEQRQLAEELENSKQLNDELHKQLSTYKEVEATLKAQAGQANEALAEKEERARQAIIEAQNLKSELEQNQEKLNQEQQEVIRLKAAKQAMASSQQQALKRIEAAQKESKRLIDEANAQITTLEEQLSGKDDEIADWKRQFDEAVAEHESQLNTYRDQITSWQSLASEAGQQNNLSDTENKLLQKQLSDLQAGEALLKEQLTEWQTKHQALEKQHHLLVAAESESQSALVSSQEARANAETLASERESELQKLKSDYQQLIDDSETKQKQHDKVLGEALEENARALQDQITSSQQTISELERQFEASQVLLSNTQKAQQEAQSRADDFQARLEEEQARNQQAISREQTLSDDLERLQTVRAELEQKKSEVENKRDEYLTELDNKTEQIQKLEVQLGERELEIATLSDGDEGVKVLSGKVAQLQEEVQTLTADRDQQVDAVRNTLQQKQQAELELEQLRLQGNELEQKHQHAIREVKDQLEQREQSVNDLDAALNELTIEKAKADNLIKAAESDLQRVNDELKQQQVINTQLKDQAEGFKNEKEEQVKEVTKLKQAQSELTREKLDLESQISDLTEKAEELTALQVEYQDVKSQLNESNTKLIEKVEGFGVERHRWDSERTSLNSQLSELRLQSAIAKERIEYLSGQFEASKNDYEALKQVHKQTVDDLDKLTPENERLRNEEKRLRRELDNLQEKSSKDYETLKKTHARVATELTTRTNELEQKTREVKQLKEDMKGSANKAALLQSRLDKELRAAQQRAETAEAQVLSKENDLIAGQQALALVKEEKSMVESDLQVVREKAENLRQELDLKHEQLGQEQTELSDTLNKLKNTEAHVKSLQDSHQRLEAEERKTREQLGDTEAQIVELEKQIAVEKGLAETAYQDRDQAFQKRDEAIREQQAFLRFGRRSSALVKEGVKERSQEKAQESDSDDDVSSTDSGYSYGPGSREGIVEPLGVKQLVQELQSFQVNNSEYVVPQGDEDQIKTALFKAGAALEEEKENIEKNSRVYHYKSGEPPSQSEKRKQIIQALKTCGDSVKRVRDKYKTDEQGSGSRKAIQKYLDRIDASTALFEAEQKAFESARTLIREHSFDEGTKPFDSLVQTSSSNPHDLVTRVLVKLRYLQQNPSGSPIQEELDGYTAAFLATSACATLKLQFQESVRELEGQSDPTLKSLLAYKEALQRMLPGRLPLELADAISPNSRHYMEKQIAGAMAAIESAAEGDRGGDTNDFAPTYPQAPLDALDPLDAIDPRGESGKRLALSLLDNPEFARDVLSFLASVRKEHSGIEKPWYNYTAASTAWLRDMRRKHGLIDMPTFSELYEACQFDLKSRNASRLVTARVTSNEGDFSSKKQGSKREKLVNQVKGCLDEEQKLIGTAEAFRGQPNNGNELIVHPHRQVLDSFKKGTDQQLLDSSAVSRVDGSYRITDLGKNTNALFNTFFDGAGKASVKQSVITGTRYLQLQNSKCVPPLVFEEKRDQWKVSMAGAVWTVDPALLLDHPGLVVPFENRSGKPPVQRDWIPVRDDQGNTGILLLQKTRSNPQYFLYEVDASGQLVPRTISDQPVAELQQARFLSEFATLKADNKAQVVVEKQPLVQAILGSKRKWLPVNCEAQAHQLYLHSLTGNPVRAPVETVDASDDLQFLSVTLNPLRSIIKTKREERHKSSTTLTEYNPEHYASFNVDATFNIAGDAFTSTSQARLRHDSDPVLKELAAEQARFRKEVFKPLYVFEGCELRPQLIPASMDGEPPEGSPVFVLRRLDHVMTVNREHCTRLTEQMAVLRQQIVQQVSSADRELFSRYSERQILNQVMADFERGRLPAHCRDDQFINLVANLMLAENDLAQTQQILSRQGGVKRDLQQLAADAPMMIDEKGGDRAAYADRCRKMNLDLADCATAQENIHRSLESYAGVPLTTDVLAKLSFERRARTVLRANQIEEVNAALQQLTDCMDDDADDKTMSRVSHKGTGWGKSTILKILTAHAAELAEGQNDCSVVVCAPVTNQAELDIDLSRFYAAKGKVYRRLDLEKDFVKPGQAWWTEETLRKIENIVLGVAPEVPENQRQTVLRQQGQAPVGVSVKDVQILKHLLNALESKDSLQPDEQKVVDRLHSIFGVLARSPTFIDEWVSLVVPYRTTDPKSVLEATQQAVSALPHYQLTMDDIIRSHDEYVMSCSRRHLLCATPGTNYAQAVVAKADKAEDIKELAHTDPFTTQQRFNFWMSEAEPIFITAPATDNRPELLRQVVSKVGTGRSVLFFDGTESGDKTVEKAKALYEDLKTARKEYAPKQAQKARGMVFYNKQKEMQQYLEDDPRYGQESGATVLPEEEALMRQEGGTGIDVYFTLEQSEGTDAPQKGPDGDTAGSVGVCLGLVEQGKEGRADAAAQQLGRLMRRSTPRNLQKLFVVVDMKAVADICSDSPQKEKLLALSSELEAAKAKVAGHTGTRQEKLSSLQRKLVNQPLGVEDNIDDEKQIRKANKDTPDLIPAALDDRLEKRMQEQLHQLTTLEWSQFGICGQFAEDLAQLKQLEWKAKKAWVELAFVEMAKREQNDDTRHYEALLEQAQVRSHVNGQLEKEHQWLQKGCDGVCQNLTFSEDVNKQLGSERQRTMILQSFRDTTEALMQQSPRRIADKLVDKLEVKALVKPDFAKQQIERCAGEIVAKGLEQVVTDPLKAVRKELYEKAIQAREVLVQRVRELESHILEADKSVAATSGSYIRNLKGLTKVREQAQQEIAAFQSVLDKQDQPSEKLDDMSIALREDIRRRYEQMMDALTNVSFTNYINQPLKDSILKKVKNTCAKFVTNSTHKLDFYHTNLEREEKRRREVGVKEEAAKAGAGKKTKKSSPTKRKGTDVSPVKPAPQVESVYLITWKKTAVAGSHSETRVFDNNYEFSGMLFGDFQAQPEKSSKGRPASRQSKLPKSSALNHGSRTRFFSTPDLRGTADPEKKVNELISTARSLKEEQRDDEAIRQFCGNPESPVFRQCLDEWKEQALSEMNAFYRGRQEESEAEVDFMTRQANMMQQYTVKTQ
ncbi:hypothetical protein [Endozoicomonas euniceicola]|uniref:Chromosome segregation ATPase n=1 Tax=Endozoicomonas euniceicola TaxID=1234143 RepID=A0ABY6GRL2_9GAMM|nr:hypothetical protein [Endozoicomonas euniceicola]UYM15212.1 hypothetical protein NX720_20470 [Endozoicomonas euniceicola]